MADEQALDYHAWDRSGTKLWVSDNGAELESFASPDDKTREILRLAARERDLLALVAKLQERTEHSDECSEQMFESAMDIRRWQGTRVRRLGGTPVERPRPPEPECTCGLAALLASPDAQKSPERKVNTNG